MILGLHTEFIGYVTYHHSESVFDKGLGKWTLIAIGIALSLLWITMVVNAIMRKCKRKDSTVTVIHSKDGNTIENENGNEEQLSGNYSDRKCKVTVTVAVNERANLDESAADDPQYPHPGESPTGEDADYRVADSSDGYLQIDKDEGHLQVVDPAGGKSDGHLQAPDSADGYLQAIAGEGDEYLQAARAAGGKSDRHLQAPDSADGYLQAVESVASSKVITVERLRYIYDRSETPSQTRTQATTTQDVEAGPGYPGSSIA